MLKSIVSTEVNPSSYIVDNFGPDVQAVTIVHDGTVHTINRRGGSNVKGYFSNVRQTYTLTNGTDRITDMDVSLFDFVSVYYTDGSVESNDYLNLKSDLKDTLSLLIKFGFVTLP